VQSHTIVGDVGDTIRSENASRIARRIEGPQELRLTGRDTNRVETRELCSTTSTIALILLARSTTLDFLAEGRTVCFALAGQTALIPSVAGPATSPTTVVPTFHTGTIRSTNALAVNAFLINATGWEATGQTTALFADQTITTRHTVEHFVEAALLAVAGIDGALVQIIARGNQLAVNIHRFVNISVAVVVDSIAQFGIG